MFWQLLANGIVTGSVIAIAAVHHCSRNQNRIFHSVQKLLVSWTDSGKRPS